MPVAISVIGVLEPSSVFTFLLVLLAASLLHKHIFGSISKDIFITYSYYSFCAICFAVFHFVSYGEYFDLGGNPAQIGGDDLKYSIEALTGVPYWSGHESLLPYSNLLRLFCLGISLFKEPNYIDLLMVNVLAISFVPIFVSKFSNLLFVHKDASSASFLLTLFCPILLVNSVILYRDGWTALFFIATLYFIFSKRYLLALIFLIGELYLRMGGGLLLLFIAGVLWFRQILEYRMHLELKMTIVMSSIVIISVMLLIANPYILKYIAEKMGGDILFRTSFVVKHMIPAASEQGVTSGVVALYTAPLPIRLFGGFLFFFVAPTFSLNYLYSVHGIFWLTQFVLLIFPFMMLFYIVWFISGGIYAIKKKDKDIVLLFAIYLFSIFVISQLSLQIRHKVMFMPLFYVLVSYGFCFKSKIGMQSGLITSAGLFVLQFGYVILKFM
jgi:hypothetical protein